MLCLVCLEMSVRNCTRRVEAEANIGVYIQNPAGIGEHPDLVAAIDTQIERIAHAEDKLSVLKDYYL